MVAFDYKDYKIYLKKILSTKGDSRGSRSKLAKALGCQTGFISQVLNGNTHFSLEHSAAISNLLGHDKEEKHYFMLLVLVAKAGSVDLQNYYNEQIKNILGERKEIKKRIKVTSELTEKDYVIYYSQWYYAAIHILVSISNYQSKESISKKLNLTSEIVSRCLKFLTIKGLVQEDSGIYKIGKARIHLDKKSPMITKHHTNWRLEAIKSLENEKTSDMHYSSVITLSKKDAEKIKEVMLKSLEEIETILRPSPEEEIYSLSIDFFNL